MIFRERIFLALSTQSEYRWYCYSIFFVLGCLAAWWNFLYRPWLRQVRDVRQELQILQKCKAGRNIHQQAIASAGSPLLCIDLSHLVVQKVSDTRMMLHSLQKKEAALSEGQECVPFELTATGEFTQLIALCNQLATVPSFIMTSLDIRLIEPDLLRFTCTFLTIDSAFVLCSTPLLTISRNPFQPIQATPISSKKNVLVTAQLCCDATTKTVCFVIQNGAVVIQEKT